MAKKTVSINIEDNLYQRLQALAKANHTTVTDIIQKLIEYIPHYSFDNVSRKEHQLREIVGLYSSGKLS